MALQSQPLQFSLRQLLAAMAGFSVLFAGIAAFGLVEVLEVLMAGFAVTIWVLMIRYDARRPKRMPISAIAAVHVALVLALTFGALVVDFWSIGNNTSRGIIMTVAYVPMFPLSLLHHLVCRWQGWHSGLAQPGTFLLIATLNALLWIRAGYKLRRGWHGPKTS